MALAGVLLALLTLVVASFSYGAEVLTLEQAVSLALQETVVTKMPEHGTVYEETLPDGGNFSTDSAERKYTI